ncbi:MAG: hypothetical protein IJ368_07070, partial [Oscillospiraceae bacterium]|nr:hypothetical protein [Oscillospiraceae bacterium]
LRTNYITSLAADGGEIKFLSSIVAPLLFLTETLFLLLGSHIIDKWTNAYFQQHKKSTLL